MIVLVLLSVVSLVRADYECLCNYNVETPVLEKPTESSKTIGTLYEFDCKPVVHSGEADGHLWGTIAYEQQEGYVKLNSGLKIQTCPGNPDENDLITTKFPPTTTTSTTLQTETPSRSPTTNPDIAESSSSLTPSTSTSALATTEQQTTLPPTSVPRSTTISTARPSTTSKMASSTQEFTTNEPSSSSSVSPTTASTTVTTQTSTELKTTSTLMPKTTSISTVTSKPTTTSTTITPSIKPSMTTKSTTTSTTASTSSRPSSTTTTRASTVKLTSSSPAPFSIGNTILCPSLVRQHASRNYGILAQYGGSCYSIERSKVSWTHAESTCRQYGGHLLHINSAAENYFIYKLLDTKYNHTVWMGLHDRGHEEQFTWTSGSPVNYTNWYPYRKSNFMNHNDEDCVVFVPYLHHGQWDDVDCGINGLLVESLFEAHPFICQYAVTSFHPTTAPTTPIRPLHYTQGNIDLCPSNRLYLGITSHLAQYGDSCYEWFTGRASWQHAESNCVTHGGHLVQIKDANEEGFIQWFLNNHDPRHAIWIGLYDIGHEETFKWTSGDPVNYTNWIPGRKDNFVSHTVEDCVAYIPYKQGQWDDIPCGSSGGLFGDSGETHPYTCEYSKYVNGLPPDHVKTDKQCGNTKRHI